jgi:leucyl aminopeptidase (aminopeptidase T)
MDKAEGYSPLRTLHIAELGIGCNHNISISIGEFLDEKRFGSVHLGFGNNKIIGGESDSHGHLDFNTDNRCTVTVEYQNGVVKDILRHGKYVAK